MGGRTWLSAELIELLGKVPGLGVPARTSSFYFKGKQATLVEIGKALNVTHVLEGSVQKAGDAVRIRTELVNIADDTRVWSETYDRKVDDIFKLQDDIANIRGQFSEAVRFHRRALELDPLLLDNLRQLGNAYYRSGQLDEAEAVLRSGMQRFPDAGTFHYRLGLVLLAQRKSASALSEFKAEKDRDFLVVGIPLALDALGQRAEADHVLAKAIGDEHVANGAAYQIGLIYGARGDKDQAFAWFERAYRQRDSGMLWLKFDPLLTGLRSDPRFAAMVAKMGVFD